ncbi:dermonecrotic toxin domain-containing protein [Pseudomonas sp.]|uniref:dermonecrotic toxin domain-containing protein n=1 Tax=Pseudomonas sp. TaxID=306 RepID=UPI003C579687
MTTRLIDPNSTKPISINAHLPPPLALASATTNNSQTTDFPPLPPGAVNWPNVRGIRPVEPQGNDLTRHFKVSDTQKLLVQYESLNKDIATLQGQQPSLGQFLQQHLEKALPEQRPLNIDAVAFNIYRTGADGKKTLVSSEPLLSALTRKIQELDAKVIGGQEGPEENPAVESGFYVGDKQLKNLGSLRTLAAGIAPGFAAANRTFWTRERASEKNTASPQNQILAKYKEMLSTEAALLTRDGSLSTGGKKLIDAALQYPTLDARECAFSDGARPGLYPIRVNDNTETGSLLPGAFMITTSDGSSSSSPHWPDGTKNIEGNHLNGPVVIHTNEDGFEEFETPDKALQALAEKLDRNLDDAPPLNPNSALSGQSSQGDQLLRRFAPLEGDVAAEWLVRQMEGQESKVRTAINTGLFPENEILHPNPLNDLRIKTAIEDAVDVSFQFDGTNSLLARNQKLEENQQPEWLKTLTPTQKVFYLNLEEKEQQSNETLAPLLKKIPTLPDFAKTQLTKALQARLQERYPHAGIDPDKIMVRIQSRDIVHTGRLGGSQVSTQTMSLTDLSLKNLDEWDAGSATRYSQKSMTAKLVDANDNDIRDAQGNALSLDTKALEDLIRPLDVGGKYPEHLLNEMSPDAAGARGLRDTWHASKLANLKKDAFLAGLDPTNYHATLTEDPSKKRSAEWVNAVINHTDPSTWPTVEGHEIRSSILVENGKEIEGTFVIQSPAHPSLVLYTPNAPDGLTFRELVSQDSLQKLLQKPEWRSYITDRTTPTDKYKLISKLTQFVPLDLVARAARAHEEGLSLQPMKRPLLDTLYRQQLASLIGKTNAATTSNAEVNTESTYNKLMFGVEVGSNLLELVPVIGKGISTTTRLTKAAIKALRAQGKSLPTLLKSPHGWGGVYSDFTVAATGQKLIRHSGLRPVMQARKAINARPAAHTARAPASRPGAQTKHTEPVARPNLSDNAVPETLLNSGSTPKNGIYLVDGPSGHRSFIRYTDSTNVSRLYEISPVYKFEGTTVRVINPATRRQVATMTSTGNGEWRVSELPGGRRGAQRRQQSNWPMNYVDNLLSGGPDLTLYRGLRGQAGRWFRDGMNEFYARHAASPAPRPDMPASTANSTPSETTREALITSNGLVFGEQHNQVSTNVLLIKNMEMYAKNGVKTLYLEGGIWSGNEGYTAADMDLLPDAPKNPNYIRTIPTRQDVFKAADKYGIKVVGLEHEHLTMHSTRSPSDDANNLRHTNDRLKEFNYFASKVIGQTPEGEKWIAVVGRRHINTTQGVPGIAELTGGTGIGVYDAGRGASSVGKKSDTPHIDRGQRITLSDQVGDYQIYQNVDPYLKAP